MPGILCEHCTAICCRYIALPIDTPQDRGDFDDVRWYLMHEGVSIFVEDGEWYISFNATCRHLQPDQRCGVYETRPRICRQYSTSECDYHSGDYGWEQHFTCPEHLDEYLRAHPPRTARRSRRAGRGRPRLKVRAPRRARSSGFSTAPADIRRVPLPVLGAWS
ncbi:MAG: YkgJ family cysteine cluster protein [Phycisphaerae bacterium]|jgi:Fe-S-cluster containining protein|nr:YkgJ family cysteine cluster protein [Phycisphaerae bacterium]MCZ2399573.1 YkgJ family cysteine cluster protein [Phycisphaerae bacterium]NUQ49048.1 YkgJ family cysteine cluster protein [Phycisphaerae bacterium]